jgi:hypothetical protein
MKRHITWRDFDRVKNQPHKISEEPEFGVAKIPLNCPYSPTVCVQPGIRFQFNVHAGEEIAWSQFI